MFILQRIDARSQGISSDDINSVVLEYEGLIYSTFLLRFCYRFFSLLN